MSPLSCPACHETAEPAAAIGPLAICAKCGRSLYLDDAGVRLAKGDDAKDLSAADLQTLRKARGRTR
jgi:hypothetical protein